MNHSWINDKCIVCGISREMCTTKLRMAIVGSRDYYKYERKYKYIVGSKETLARPDCHLF